MRIGRYLHMHIAVLFLPFEYTLSCFCISLDRNLKA
jgi:hypothetical protein